MKKPFYESHNLDTASLPIIFHFDLASPSDIYGSHWHENPEILYCTRGKGTVFCNFVEYTVEKGDIFVINSNMLHDMKQISDFAYHCLIVDSEFLKTNGIEADKIEFEPLIKSKHCTEIYERLISENSFDNPYRCTALRTYALFLMLHLARYHSSPSTVGSAPSDENIKLAIGYIKAHLTEKLTLSDVADEAGLSKYHFAREFKKATGSTFISFLNTLRCQNAKKLISAKTYSIREVSSLCGFENFSYFSKTFKNITGYLPSEYLKIINL